MATKETNENLVLPTTEEDSADVMRQANLKVNTAETKRKALSQLYRNEEKVPMYLSPMYRAHFGNVMNVSINGISIFFKVDGSTQLIPKTYADEITARRKAVDALLTKQHKMANIPNNLESSPGELRLI